MAFAKVSEDYITAMINYLEATVEAQKSSLEVWKANRILHKLNKDVYANRQNTSLITDKGVVPDVVKSPCRFVQREEIDKLYIDSSIQTEIYKMFLDSIDNGDFLMVDDDPDEKGHPGYQLFKKECPTVDVLLTMRA